MRFSTYVKSTGKTQSINTLIIFIYFPRMWVSYYICKVSHDKQKGLQIPSTCKHFWIVGLLMYSLWSWTCWLWFKVISNWFSSFCKNCPLTLYTYLNILSILITSIENTSSPMDGLLSSRFWTHTYHLLKCTPMAIRVVPNYTDWQFYSTALTQLWLRWW